MHRTSARFNCRKGLRVDEKAGGAGALQGTGIGLHLGVFNESVHRCMHVPRMPDASF